MSEFTQEEVEKLISLVSKNNMLYDPELPEYNHTQLKENIWNEIAITLNKTNENCKKQWKVIRDSYVRFKRTNNLSTLDSATKKTRNWTTYKLMTFLDTITQRKISRRVIKPSAKKTVSNDDDSYFETDEYPLSDSDNNQQTHSDVIPDVEIDLNMNPVDPLHDTHLNRHDDSLDSLQENVRNNAFANRINSTDDIGSFAIYVKDVLRMLPPVLQINAKQDIFNVLSKYQLIVVNKDEHTDNNTNIKMEG